MIYGARIKQVRELRGLTQKELAQRLGVHQSFVAQIEGERVPPPAQFIESLCLQTGFPPSFFGEEPDTDFPLGSLLFRAHAKMTLREKAEMYNYGKTVWGMLKRLKVQRPIKEIPLHILPVGIKDSPGFTAEMTRSTLGHDPNTPIQNLTHVLEKAGVVVLALPKAFEDREAYSLWSGSEPRQPVIVLSRGKPGDRLRLSIAHELGHLVMHHPATGAAKDIEKEAYQFAGELLMPRSAMIEEITPPVSLDMFTSLKLRWGVSIAALIMRARDLQIITPRKQRFLFQKLSERGWRRTEPQAFAVPVEKPRALRQIAELIYGRSFKYEKIATDVRLSEKFVREVLEVYSGKASQVGSTHSPESVDAKYESSVISFPAGPEKDDACS